MPEEGYTSAMVVLAILSALQLVAFVLLLVVVKRSLSQFKTQIDSLKAEAVEFIASIFRIGEDGKPSQFAEMVDGIATVLANRLVTSFTAAIRGSAGGTAKAEAEAAIAQNPLLGMFGKGSKMGKNPVALAVLSFIGQKLFPGGLPVQASGTEMVPTNGGAPKFKL